MDSTYLGKRIKEIRCRESLSQAELAEFMGIGGSTLCEYENGNKTPSLNNFIKIAQCLNCTPNELLQDYLPSDDEGCLCSYRTIIQSLAQLPVNDLEKAADALGKLYD